MSETTQSSSQSSDGANWGAIIPALLAAGGGIANFIKSKRSSKDAREMHEAQLQQALKAAGLWDSISPPEYQQLLAYTLDQNLMNEDPGLRSYQLQALEELSDYADDGMTDDTKYRLGLIEERQAQADRGAREGLIQNFNQRGAGGSGLEFAAQMMAQQNSANQANMAGLQQAAEAEQRKVGAQQSLSQQAGAMRGMDMNANQARADIQRYNNDVQRMADQYNNSLRSQNFADKMNITSGKANAMLGVSNVYGGQGSNLYNQANQQRQTGGQLLEVASDAGTNWLDDYINKKDKNGGS